MIGSGGNRQGSRAIRIESRKGILSRKSSVNKNSFYKQKSKDTIPNKIYPNQGIGPLNPIGSRGASSYFNKNPGSVQNQGVALPSIGHNKGASS
jgi:hypothetical protein